MATANLIEALVEWADAQVTLAQAFPGGIWNTDAPTGPATALPYLVFTQADSRQLNILGGSRWVQWMTVALEARATTAAVARQLGDLVRDLILPDAAPPPPLSWTGGLECGRYLGEGEGGELEDTLGPDGTDVWVHRIAVTFMTARG